jgi:hypothetical protein
MATYLSDGQQTLSEIRKHVFDYTDDLLTGITVGTAACTYMQPNGTVGTATVSITSPYVYATMGTLSITGLYILSCLATFSNSETSEIRVTVNVLPAVTAIESRAGLSDLRDALRVITDVTESDWSIGQQNFWDDLQLDKVLDRHYVEADHELLTSEQHYDTTPGSVSTHDYYSQLGNFETVASGTSYFIVQDATGLVHGTSEWDADYALGQISFTANTLGSAMYLTAYAYDLNASAADIWQRKASHYATAFDFSTDNHNLRRSQIYDHCLKMADYYGALAGDTNSGAGGMSSISMTRSDCTTENDSAE